MAILSIVLRSRRAIEVNIEIRVFEAIRQLMEPPDPPTLPSVAESASAFGSPED